MARKHETKLKTYFSDGDEPTQAQFEDLIDSQPTSLAYDNFTPDATWNVDQCTFTRTSNVTEITELGTATDALIIPWTPFPCSIGSLGDAYENGAFQGSNVNSLTIPSSVTLIGSYAFIWTLLQGSLIIPDSVTDIGGDAFNSCDSIGDVYCNIAIGSFPSSALNYAGAGNLYVHEDYYAGYAGTHGTKTVLNWDNYPDPIPN